MNEHEKVGAGCGLALLSSHRISASTSARYSYHFAALGGPQDIAATIVEDLPVDAHPDRPWGHRDNPKTVVWKYLENHVEFEIDDSMDNKLLMSVAPRGFLRRKM